MFSPLKRITCKCSIRLIILLWFLYQIYFTRSGLRMQEILHNNLGNIVSPVQDDIGSSTKYILQWTPPNYLFVQWGQGQKKFIQLKCKVNDCYITSNRHLLSNITHFDAVAFHGPEFNRYWEGPAARSAHQKYVYVSRESAHYYPICDKKYDGYFNWTWTYRLDSDENYGYITIRNITGDIIGPKKIMHWIKLDSMQSIDIKTKMHLKTKKIAAAWFVSNCDSLSKREAYVKKLQQNLHKYGLNVDIFGDCTWAPKQCPLSKKQMCFKMIQEDYYFYLSLENSFSEDYVTEKLLIALQNYAVPIVYGAANYTRFMPVGIYLHAGKLKPPDLAKEMNDIIKDENRYYNFFKWRNHYSYHDKSEVPDTDNYCRMCEMLHDETLVNKTTVYTDFRKWWNVPGGCPKPKTNLPKRGKYTNTSTDKTKTSYKNIKKELIAFKTKQQKTIYHSIKTRPPIVSTIIET